MHKMGIPEKYRNDPFKSKTTELRIERDVIGDEDDPDPDNPITTRPTGICYCDAFGPHDHMIAIGHDPEAEETVVMDPDPSLYRL